MAANGRDCLAMAGLEGAPSVGISEATVVLVAAGRRVGAGADIVRSLASLALV